MKKYLINEETPPFYLFTSESVAEGHPDKTCDQISDTLLDAYLTHDPLSRVAIECMVAPNNLILSGEFNSNYKMSLAEVEAIVRLKIKEIGYYKEPFNWQTIKVTNLLHAQSPEIAFGVSGDKAKDEGAGDQGIMFGYAIDENEDFMPAPIYYSHRIIRNIMQAVKDGKIIGLGVDGKSQVTLRYDYKSKKPIKAEMIVVSIQHDPILSQPEIREIIRPYVIAALPQGWMCSEKNFLVNPAGKFTIGGPESDTGLTGRKIIVDTYGGAAPHGGGAFSGKDASKVDRSAAYMARYIAKNIVASGVADRCLIQLSYAIGIAEPLSVYINTYGTSKFSDLQILAAIQETVSLKPRDIRNHLKLDQPIYTPTATYGHFGRKPGESGSFTWERTDLIKDLLVLLK